LKEQQGGRIGNNLKKRKTRGARNLMCMFFGMPIAGSNFDLAFTRYNIYLLQVPQKKMKGNVRVPGCAQMR